MSWDKNLLIDEIIDRGSNVSRETLQGYSDQQLVELANMLRAQEIYKCVSCKKVLDIEKDMDTIVPMRTIDPKTGCDTFDLYCEDCYKKFTKKVYGF